MEKTKTLSEKIQTAISNNTEEKVFGCIHCKEDSEIIVTDMTMLVYEINNSLPVIKDLLHDFFNHKSDANSEWGLLYTTQQEQLEKEFSEWAAKKFQQ